MADIAKLLIAVASLFAYGLVFYVPMDTLWKNVSHKINEKNHNIAQILIRTVIILISGVVATVIPNLEPFISLVGAIFLSLLGMFTFCEICNIFSHIILFQAFWCQAFVRQFICGPTAWASGNGSCLKIFF